MASPTPVDPPPPVTNGRSSGPDVRASLLRITKGSEPPNGRRIARGDNCCAVAKHEISAEGLKVDCKMSKCVQRNGRISRVCGYGVMAQVPHQRFVIHRRCTDAIDDGSKTPPKPKLQSSVASDKRATGGITRVTFVYCSRHPQKAMRFDRGANNFSSSSESCDDLCNLHSRSGIRVASYEADLETGFLERLQSRRHQFIPGRSINYDVYMPTSR